ncbi:MAG: putative membrane protein/Ni/Co efflux regulator RcnB [Bacteriovoracaceae bacterium]|jgi:uncharacterized membrane protein
MTQPKEREMKRILLAVLAVSTLGAAHAQDRQTLEAKLLKATNNLQRAVDRNLTVMTVRDLRQALKSTREAISIVRGQGGGGGNGGGNGGNQYIANVKFESDAFLLQAGDIGDFEQQCLVRAEEVGQGQIDDIYLSFNGATQVKERTSGWWRTNAEKCKVLTKMILNESMKQGIHLSRKQYIMTGDADSQPILAMGNNIFELEQSCTENLVLQGQVDDISVSVNGGAVKTSRTSGWWRTSAEVCRNAVAILFN